jgi:hypothetical protein
MSQARFQKRMREKAKQEKQALKRERKAERAEAAEAAADEPAPEAPPASTVLDQLAELHRSFADDEIEFDEFEERKSELIAQLDV